MPIAVACECGHDFEVRDELRGRRLKCPSCSQPIEAGGTPSRNGSGPKLKAETSKSDLLALRCQCGKRIAAKREWAGKRVKCPSCGESVKIPGGPSKKPRSSSSMGDLLDEVGVVKAAQRCPECKSVMQQGHVICTNCGFDVERGKKLRTKTYQSSARKLDMLAGAKQPGTSLVTKIVMIAIALAVIATAAILVPRFLG